MNQNFIANAAGSVKQAGSLVIQQIQEIRVTTANYEEVIELLALVDKLVAIRCRLDSMASRYGDTRGDTASAASGAVRRQAARA